VLAGSTLRSLPVDFGEVVNAVTPFADAATGERRGQAVTRDGSRRRSHSRLSRRRGTPADGPGRIRTDWTVDVLPEGFLRRVAVGYDPTRVAFAGRRRTPQTVRRVHGMEEVRDSIPLSSTTRNRRSGA